MAQSILSLLIRPEKAPPAVLPKQDDAPPQDTSGHSAFAQLIDQRDGQSTGREKTAAPAKDAGLGREGGGDAHSAPHGATHAKAKAEGDAQQDKAPDDQAEATAPADAAPTDITLDAAVDAAPDLGGDIVDIAPPAQEKTGNETLVASLAAGFLMGQVVPVIPAVPSGSSAVAGSVAPAAPVPAPAPSPTATISPATIEPAAGFAADLATATAPLTGMETPLPNAASIPQAVQTLSPLTPLVNAQPSAPQASANEPVMQPAPSVPLPGMEIAQSSNESSEALPVLTPPPVVATPNVPDEPSNVTTATIATVPNAQAAITPQPAQDLPSMTQAPLVPQQTEADLPTSALASSVATPAVAEAEAAVVPPVNALPQAVTILAQGDAGETQEAAPDVALASQTAPTADAQPVMRRIGKLRLAEPAAPQAVVNRNDVTAVAEKTVLPTIAASVTAKSEEADGSGVDAVDVSSVTAAAPSIVPPTASTPSTLKLVANADHAGAPAQQLAGHLTVQVKKQNTHFSLELQPAQLGRVQVSLDITRDGQVQMQIRTETVQAMEALQRDRAMLEQSLQDLGLTTDQNSLNFSLHKEGDSSAFARDEPGSANLGTTRAMVSEDNTPPPAALYRVVRQDGLDIHV